MCGQTKLSQRVLARTHGKLSIAWDGYHGENKRRRRRSDKRDHVIVESWRGALGKADIDSGR
jgi:hypothetical protein